MKPRLKIGNATTWRSCGFVRATACGMIALMFACGCGTTKPWERSQSKPWDFTPYKPPREAEKRISDEKMRVAILVPEADHRNHPETAKAMEAEMTSRISSLNKIFQIAERSNQHMVEAERWIQSNKGGISGADYLITASVNSLNINSYLSSVVVNGQIPTYWNVSMGFDFRFYELETGDLIMAKTVRRGEHKYFDPLSKYKGLASQGVAVSRVAEAVVESIREFADELAVRAAPPARVLETRAKGGYAKISMGKDHGAKKNMLVDILELVQYEGEDKPRLSQVSTGRITDVNAMDSWIKTNKAKRGHYVKITIKQ